MTIIRQTHSNTFGRKHAVPINMIQHAHSDPRTLSNGDVLIFVLTTASRIFLHSDAIATVHNITKHLGPQKSFLSTVKSVEAPIAAVRNRLIHMMMYFRNFRKLKTTHSIQYRPLERERERDGRYGGYLGTIYTVIRKNIHSFGDSSKEI